MKKFLSIAALSLVAAAPAMARDADAVVAAPASSVAPAQAQKGKMLVDASGGRLAPVMRVGSDGSAQIVFDGRVVSVPASTLSMVNGKLTTSLKKTEVIALR